MKQSLPDTTSKGDIRLQVRLARSGLGSRRKCEEYIAAARITVNGKTVIQPGTKVDPDDVIAIDGHRIPGEQKKIYIALHKPPGFLSSNSDPRGRPLAKNLLETVVRERVYHVGRLDFMSSGLIFYTNDGDFARLLTHPSHVIEKEYIVGTKHEIPKQLMERFMKGININGILYKASHVRLIGARKAGIVLTEGKNREIREVFRSFGIGISKVHRVRIGPITLKEMPPGHFRYLSLREVTLIRKNHGSRH